eukprot:scaffold35930_cov55-Attheya_sp.AAC.5
MFRGQDPVPVRAVYFYIHKAGALAQVGGKSDRLVGCVRHLSCGGGGRRGLFQKRVSQKRSRVTVSQKQ